MGIGALANLGISKGMSLGRELFGFLLRSDLNVAKIAEWAGITMDTLKDAPPEALSAILERAARSGAIDPREANNINIQLAKDAQEAMPAMPTLKAQDAANKLSKQFGVNFDVSNHPTAYGNSTYVSGRIPGPGRTNVRVGFRLSDHETGDIRKATDDFLTIIDDGNVSAESLVAEVQSQIERALPKMQKISDDREAKTIAQSDALSRWSELSGDERGEIAVKFNETRPTRFNNVPWKNLTKQQKADFAVDGPLAKDAQEAYKDSFNIDAIHGQYDVGNSRGFQTYGPDTEKGGFGETPGEALNAFEGTDQKEDNFWTSDLGSWFADRSTGGNDVANYFAGADKTSADLARDNPEFGGAVYPVKLQMKNPFVFETHDELEQAMAEFSEMVGDEYWKKELARVEGKTNRFGEPMKPDPFGGPSAGTQGYVQYLRDMGYDGIKILDSNTDTGNSRTDYVTFTPQQIRSIWAKFDPAKKDSPNISAGVAGGAVGLGALQTEGDQ
jgi:hypothetical protein